MRTAKISIDGREYLLCFSARVMRACTERYGGVESIDDLAGLKGKISETITNGRTPTLDAVPPKNGEATPGA